MKQTRAALLFVLATILAACAPAASRPALIYRAPQADILAAVSQFGPTVQPNSGYNFLGIEGIGDTYITLSATLNPTFAALTGNQPESTVKVTVTTAKTAGGTQVAVNGVGPSRVGLETADKVIAELDARFQRVQAPN